MFFQKHSAGCCEFYLLTRFYYLWYHNRRYQADIRKPPCCLLTAKQLLRSLIWSKTEYGLWQNPVIYWKRTFSWMINEQHMLWGFTLSLNHFKGGFFMPKNKFQELSLPLSWYFSHGLRHDLLQHFPEHREYDKPRVPWRFSWAGDHGTDRIYPWLLPVSKLAFGCAMRMVDFKNCHPFSKILAISVPSVAFMCSINESCRNHSL